MTVAYVHTDEADDSGEYEGRSWRLPTGFADVVAGDDMGEAAEKLCKQLERVAYVRVQPQGGDHRDRVTLIAVSSIQRLEVFP